MSQECKQYVCSKLPYHVEKLTIYRGKNNNLSSEEKTEVSI